MNFAKPTDGCLTAWLRRDCQGADETLDQTAGRLGVGLLQRRLVTSPVAFDAIAERPRLDYGPFGASKLDTEPFEVSARLPQQDQRSGFARFLGLAFASFTIG